MLLYACSSNKGKLAEFELAAKDTAAGTLQIQPLADLLNIPPPEETGTTFEENASLKAVYYSERTSELVFADDSGLEVLALGNEPGVYSARYAGLHATDEENNSRLLGRLSQIADRRARFRCVIALARTGKLLTMVSGSVEGEIAGEPRGGEGFGYDPLFWYPPLGVTFAQLPPEQKISLSHRGKAIRALFDWLNNHPEAASL